MSDVSETPFRPYMPGTQPPLDAPEYGSTHKRHPAAALVRFPGGHTQTELTGPRLSPERYPRTADLTAAGGGKAIGERIIVEGRVTDEDGRPVPGAMIELWQANAGGRYDHVRDQHDAPLDPAFHGTGRVFSDADGRYRYVTIKPGAYPWRNHHNAWRPNHIHYSLFGAGLAQRLVTQMYFPGDPLLPLDPVYNAVPDAAARARLVAALDLAITQPEWALGYRFDIVLRGRGATPLEEGMPAAIASQTIGPYWHLLEDPALADLTRFGAVGERVALIGTVTDGDGLPVSDACVELWQPSPPASSDWEGFGRAATDVEGNFRFVTLKPGPVAGAAGANTPQAPHVALTMFARGLLTHLHTRAYFDGEALNEQDPLLASLDPARRATLIARPVGERDGLPAWRLDVRLQGADETVFLDI